MNNTLSHSLRPLRTSSLPRVALATLGTAMLGASTAVRADSNVDGNLTVAGNTTLSGNVGVGAAPVLRKFEVAGAAQNGSPTALMRLVTNDVAYGASGPLLEFAGKVNGGTAVAAYAALSSYTTNGTAGAHSGDLVFQTANAGTLAEKMRITASGNVNIGSGVSPVKLDVAGLIHVQNGAPDALVPGLFGLSHAGIAFAYALDTATTIAYGYSGGTNPVFQVAGKPYSADPLAAWDATSNIFLTVKGNGRVGVGTTAPTAKLEVATTSNAVPNLRLSSSGSDAYLSLKSTVTGGREFYVMSSGSGSGLASGHFTIWDQTALAARLSINESGNVFVGVTSPGYYATANTAGYKLSVEGKIHAKEVVVDSDAASWSDYVFADNYRNAPLSEVEQHIKEHRHLPGIPSAKEVEEKGVNLGKMQAALLAKVEELTLHLIEQEKRLQRLEQENAALRANR